MTQIRVCWAVLFAASLLAGNEIASAQSTAYSEHNVRQFVVGAASTETSVGIPVEVSAQGGGTFDVQSSSANLVVSLVRPDNSEAGAGNASSLDLPGMKWLNLGSLRPIRGLAKPIWEEVPPRKPSPARRAAELHDLKSMQPITSSFGLDPRPSRPSPSDALRAGLTASGPAVPAKLSHYKAGRRIQLKVFFSAGSQ
jgi:hypothetical protein